VEVDVDVVSTSGEAPETVIVSVTAPTFISESTRAVNPTVSRTPSRRTFWNPASSNTTVNTPMGSGDRRYSPRSSVTLTTDGTCSDGLVAVTVTPGNTPFVLSVTIPVMPAGFAAP